MEPLAAPHFYWSSCFVCCSFSALKKCSRCHLIYYCSPQHQKLHWKSHKKLCSFVFKEREKNPFFVQESRRPLELIKDAESSLSMTLSPGEKEMFLFPRLCRLCKGINSEFFDCTSCRSVTYCSQNHRESHRSTHEKICNELRLARLCDEYESHVSLPNPSLPSDIDESFDSQSLSSSNMLSILREKDKNSDPSSFCFLTDALSTPHTLLYALSFTKLASGESFQNSESLVFQFVGANILELMGLIKYEYLLHRLPLLRHLTIIFIGPELSDYEYEDFKDVKKCSDCIARDRQLTYEIQPLEYKSYVTSKNFITPDAVIAYNCGFHEFEFNESLDTWRPSLPFLIHFKKTPLIFTSYTLKESKKDLRCLEDISKNLDIIKGSEYNPYRSHRPLRDFEIEDNSDVFYRNQYISIVRKL